MWDLPGPGLELMSPALAGGFLTTVPPGKSPILFLFMAEEYPTVYMYHIFFIHSSVDGHLTENPSKLSGRPNILSPFYLFYFYFSF